MEVPLVELHKPLTDYHIGQMISAHCQLSNAFMLYLRASAYDHPATHLGWRVVNMLVNSEMQMFARITGLNLILIPEHYERCV